MSCFKDTRVNLLAQITEDVLSPDNSRTSAKIFWLQGPAGSGKSAIAHSIAAEADARGVLASSFFMTPGAEGYQRVGTNDPNGSSTGESPSAKNLLSTFIRDLAARNPAFRCEVGQRIEQTPSLSTAGPLEIFQELLFDPIVSLPHAFPKGQPVTWVVDGFDELEYHDTSGYSKQILDIFCDQWKKLPPNFSLFITSRPQSGHRLFKDTFDDINMGTLSPDMQGNDSDMVLIAQEKLRLVAERNEAFTTPERTSSQFLSFVKKAEGSPLWVTVVANHLEEATVDPMRELDNIISVEPEQDFHDTLYTIYGYIVERCVGRLGRNSLGLVGEVVDILLALREPVQLKTLQDILRGNSELSDTSIWTSIKALRPLLIGVDTDRPIEFIHLSVREYLAGSKSWLRSQSGDRSPKLSKHLYRANRLLFEASLRSLSKHFEDTTADSVDVGNESAPLVNSTRLLNPSVLYAYQYWVAHITKTEALEKDDTTIITDFLENHFEPWTKIQCRLAGPNTIMELKTYILVRGACFMH